MPDKTINTVFLLCTSVLKLPLHICESERNQTDRLAESKRVYERNVNVVKLTPACESRLTVSQRVSEFMSEACTWSGRRLQKTPLYISNSERKQTDRSEESKRVYEQNVYVVKLTPACYQGFTVPIISFTDLMPLLSRNSFISSIIFTGA